MRYSKTRTSGVFLALFASLIGLSATADARPASVEVEDKATRSGESVTVTVKYTCVEGEATGVSVDFTDGGKLAGGGSTRVSCDGKENTAAVEVTDIPEGLLEQGNAEGTVTLRNTTRRGNTTRTVTVESYAFVVEWEE
ncbi:hypothetical protein ACWDYH_28855 [Nocardia goodfellowii]